MPFEIVRNDICQVAAEAVVNSACELPLVGSGVDCAIYQKAGPELFEARRHLGNIPVGAVAVTPGFALGAKHILHTASPRWQGGGCGEEALLERCWESCLSAAWELGCASVAFPLLGAGNMGFPGEAALRCALSSISRFLAEHELRVILTVYGREAFDLSGKIFANVQSYIDEHYVEESSLAQRRFLASDAQGFRREDFRDYLAVMAACAPAPAEDTEAAPPPAAAAKVKKKLFTRRPARGSIAPSAPAPATEKLVMEKSAADEPPSLEELLRRQDAGFSESLLRLIDERGLSDPQVYKRANMDRKHFSKIRTRPDYRPGKATALALAIALELNLAETAELLARAGYAMSRSSKSDIIIEYFITQGNYDIFEINQALFAFDQPLLGG